MIKFTPVQFVVNIYDPNIWWYSIDNFRGYEISNTYLIRSMKHFNKYPFGILIQPKKDRDGKVIHPENPSYEFSDNNNERQVVTLSQIIDIVKTAQQMPGFPRRTIVTNQASRTQRAFIKKPSMYPPLSNDLIYYKFPILEEAKPETNPEIIVPVKSITGEEYYGRTDN